MAFEFKLPDIGEGVVEGEIVRWLIQQGDVVAEDQPMVEVMTDKATVEIPSPVAGKVLQTIGDEGEVVEVGSVMVVIASEDGPASRPEPEPAQAKAAKPTKTSAPAPATRPSRGKVLATPAIRKMARGLSVDLSRVEGTGPGGRISRDDVERYIRAQSDPTPASEPVTATRSSTIGQEVETIPYRGLRKKIGDHMVAAKRFAPHYTYVEEVDVTELVALRATYRKTHPKSGLTYLPFLIKAAVRGLQKFPLLNATLDEEKQLIQLKRYYNIGVAAATPEGLIVPVLKNADSKGLLQISEEITALASQAREGRAKLEDLRDGTFTITSLGLLGGVLATPIINYPEVAIMGVHKIQAKPVVRDGEIVIRQMMNLSLSLDHRVVDGVVGAEFLRHIIGFLEHPGMLAID